MLSVAVHKDIAEYQPKIVGKMTMRTLVSITGALSVSVLAGLYIYFVLGLNVSDCTYFIYAVSFGCPKCLWLKPYPPNLFLTRERICDYASATRRILETIRQRFRRPAAPRPKPQISVSAEPNGNLIVELVHRIFRRFRFQIEYHAVFVLSRVVVSRHTHDSFPSTRQAH